MTDFEEWTKTELIQEIVRLRMRLSQRNDKLNVKRDGNLATDPVVRPKNVAADLVTATSVPAETTVDDQSESQQYWYNLVASRYIRHHTDRCVLLFTLLAQLVVYVSTCYPTIAGGDSAEIVAAACSKGAFECFVIKKWTKYRSKNKIPSCCPQNSFECSSQYYFARFRCGASTWLPALDNY